MLLFRNPLLSNCFVLGSGASVSSGIPSGQKLAEIWLNEIKGDLSKEKFEKEISRRIEILTKSGKNPDVRYLKFKDYDYLPNLKSTLDDYNIICELRFLNDKEAEQKAIFQLMDNITPYIGYYALSGILSNTKNDMIITLNFDELIETAINFYTDIKPICINHESLASFANERVTNRPKILKLHRDIVTGGLNNTEETSQLMSEWKEPLHRILSEYTPIVIGYAGTDNSFMPFLWSDEISHGIYWCHMFSDLPNDMVINLVKTKKGKLVEIWEFDHIMCHIASILCGNKTFQNQIIGRSLGSGYYAYRMATVINTLKRNNKKPEITEKHIDNLKKKATPISVLAMITVQLGMLLYSCKLFLPAIFVFNLAFKYEIKKHGLYYGKAKYNIAVAYERAGKLIEGERINRELLASDFKDSGNLYLRSNAIINLTEGLIDLKRYDEAKSIISDHLNERRCDGTLYLQKGVASYYLEEYREAVDDLTTALDYFEYEKNHKLAIRAYRYRSLVYNYLGDHHLADADSARIQTILEQD